MGNNQNSKNKNKKEKLEIGEQINKYNEIKSKYILKQIFDNVTKNKYLNIIKYNKNIQQKLEIGLNDYKESCILYSSIIINLIPKKNLYLKFINIINKADKKYYPIYFNNKKNEKKEISYKTNRQNK